MSQIKTTVTDAATLIIGNKIKQSTAIWFAEEYRQAIGERNYAHRRFVMRRTRKKQNDLKEQGKQQTKQINKRKQLTKIIKNQIQNMGEDFKDNVMTGAYGY